MGVEYSAIIKDYNIKDIVSTTTEKEFALLRHKNTVSVKIGYDIFTQFTRFGIKPIVCKDDDGKYILI